MITLDETKALLAPVDQALGLFAAAIGAVQVDRDAVTKAMDAVEAALFAAMRDAYAHGFKDGKDQPAPGPACSDDDDAPLHAPSCEHCDGTAPKGGSIEHAHWCKDKPAPARMDAPNGPVCGCGKPSRHESGWCGECVKPAPAPACSECDGEGEVYEQGSLRTTMVPCPKCKPAPACSACQGTGMTGSDRCPGDICPACRGTGKPAPACGESRTFNDAEVRSILRLHRRGVPILDITDRLSCTFRDVQAVIASGGTGRKP